MKRTDDVYFFTLIDFLIQVFFFGLVVFTLVQVEQVANAEAHKKPEKDISSVVKWMGFSTLTELTDYLSRLAPPQNFRGWADFMTKNDLSKVSANNELVQEHGGAKPVKAALLAYARQEGYPACPYDRKTAPTPQAIVRIDDKGVQIRAVEADLANALARINLTSKDVAELTLEEFTAKLTPLTKNEPNCRYFVTYETKTEYRRPVNIVARVLKVPVRWQTQ